MSSLFFEIHKDIPREGPGENECTRKAYHMLADLPAHPHIVDIGCGPGMQTIELARLTDGTITAVDTHLPFLQRLEKQKAAAGVADKIKTLQASMFELPFKSESIDVIWSEGAIFIMGFERGLREWKHMLKPTGYLVVSEVSWLADDPPHEIKEFWQLNYPAMKTVEQYEEMVRQAGYSLLGSFTLPESGWWKDYYTPLEQRVAWLRAEHPPREEMALHLDSTQSEIEMYRKYSAYYGYQFFIMQRKG